MTKIIPVVLSPYQLQIFNSTARVSLVTGAFGIGNSYGLLMKAFKEASEGKLVTYFKAHSSQIVKSGGVFCEATKLADKFNARVSLKSQIITVGEGKIKFIGAERPLEESKGVCSDLIIMEHNIPEDVIQYHLMRSKQIMIREAFHEVDSSTPEHYLQKFGLVEPDANGKAVRIADWVEHITASWDDPLPDPKMDIYVESYLRNSHVKDIQKLGHWKF